MAVDRYLELQVLRNNLSKGMFRLNNTEVQSRKEQLRTMLGDLTNRVRTALSQANSLPDGEVVAIREPQETRQEREERAAKETVGPVINLAGSIIEGAAMINRASRDRLAFISYFDAVSSATEALNPLLLAIYGKDMFVSGGLNRVNPQKLMTAAEITDPNVAKQEMEKLRQGIEIDEVRYREMYKQDRTGKSLVRARRLALLAGPQNLEPSKGGITPFEIVGAATIETIYSMVYDHSYRRIK